MWVCNFVRYRQLSLYRSHTISVLVGNQWDSACISAATSSEHVVSLIMLASVSNSIFSMHVSYWVLVWTICMFKYLFYNFLFFFYKFTICIICPFLFSLWSCRSSLCINKIYFVSSSLSLLHCFFFPAL